MVDLGFFLPEEFRFTTMSEMTARLSDPCSIDSLRRHTKQVEARLGSTLGRLSPESVTLVANSPIRPRLVDLSLLEKSCWILSVGAGGDSSDPELLDRYLTDSGRWFASSVLLDSCGSAESLRDAVVDGAAGREIIERFAKTPIRFAWANRMICIEIARRVEDHPFLSEHIPEVTSANVDSMLSIAEAVELAHVPEAYPAVAAAFEGQALARSIAVKAGAFSGRSFSKLATSNGMEMSPWIDLNGDLIPIAPLTLVLSCERAILHLVDSRLLGSDEARRSGRAKGHLYEEVAQACIEQALEEEGLRQRCGRPMKVQTGESSSADDVDVALIEDGRLRLFAEVKAKEQPASTTAAASVYRAHVEEIEKQVNLRFSAFRSGRSIVTPESEYAGECVECAIGISLQSYSGSLALGYMQSLLDGDASRRIPIADLHSWILVLKAMSGVSELRRYLRFRSRLLACFDGVLDEGDILVAYLSPIRENMLAQAESIALRVENRLVALVPFCFDYRFAVTCEVPREHAEWRYEYFERAEPVSMAQ